MKAKRDLWIKSVGPAVAMLIFGIGIVETRAQAPAGAYRIIQQQNYDATGSPAATGFLPGTSTTIPGAPGGAKGDLLPQGGRNFSDAMDGGPLTSVFGIDAGGTVFTLFYIDPANTPEIVLDTAAINPSVYSAIDSYQAHDLLDQTRTRVDLPYRVGYCMSGLLNGTRIPNNDPKTKASMPFLTGNTVRFAQRSTGDLGFYLANTFGGSLPGPATQPPNNYYPFPSGSVPAGKTQPPTPVASALSFSPRAAGPWASGGPAAKFTAGATAAAITPDQNLANSSWTETWNIFNSTGGGPLQVNRSTPIQVYNMDSCQFSTIPAIPQPYVLKGFPSSWPKLQFTFANLYPDYRAVVIVNKTDAPTKTYVAYSGSVMADEFDVAAPATFTFDFSQPRGNTGGHFGGLFDSSGKYTLQVWVAVPFDDGNNFMTQNARGGSVSAGTEGAGSATYPWNAATVPTALGGGNWRIDQGSPWWWRLANSVDIQVEFTVGVTGDSTVN